MEQWEKEKTSGPVRAKLSLPPEVSHRVRGQGDGGLYCLCGVTSGDIGIIRMSI